MAERLALPIIITNAGRKAAVDADHNGLQLELTEIALGKALWTPDSSATALKDEFKRITIFGGVDLAADMLHFTITDDSDDAYLLGEFGIYSDTGVLFALYSQNTVISEKIAESIFMLSVDIKVDSVPPDSVTITGNNFYYPPATPDVLGVMFDAPHDGKDYVRKNGEWNRGREITDRLDLNDSDISASSKSVKLLNDEKLNKNDTAKNSEELNNIDGGYYIENHSGFTVIKPTGGEFRHSLPNDTGSIKIKFPSANLKSNTMITMKIHVYSFSPNKSFELFIAGYYNGTPRSWSNATVSMNGNDNDLRIRFCSNESESYILIGEENSIWHYLSVTILDVVLSYSNMNAFLWCSGWDISLNKQEPNQEFIKLISFAYCDGVVPGTVVMFSGDSSKIPKCWKVCDGEGVTSNGINVPDLRDRFIVCEGSEFSKNTTGGSKTVESSMSGEHNHTVSINNSTLSSNQMPAHTHGARRSNYSGGNGKGNVGGNDTSNSFNETTSAGGSGAHNHSANSNNSGNHSHTVSTLSPYYTLAFIIKL